ncbi:MAG: carboxypeptidase regulatory-like domain-containing protein [Bryobacterales bacterium]|nr:carboxypeptidase regulatory-like domain-containing protein [Bryobacterales bacterium]
MATSHLIYFLSVVLVSGAIAQVTGSIAGQILDSTASAVPGAEVVVANEATGASFRAVSDETGFYRAPQLEPGVYTVTARATGFRTAVQREIVIRVNDRLRIDLSLEVGQVTEQLTVTAPPPLLQTEDAVVGQVVDNRKILDLPLNARNWLQLATLAAGTVTYPGVTNTEGGNRQNTLMNLGGNRTANTNYLLNGSDNNTWNVPGALSYPPVDSLQEFKVETNNYTADTGRLGGAVVSAIIKSGTNSLHGTAYDFFRNRELNARNFFAPTGEKPQFTRNQYGASAGGPVIRNQVFFFVNYEGNRERQANVASRQVFTDAQKAGDFSGSLGGQAGVDGAGRPVAAGQIFDPFSTRRLANGQAIRDALPGNRIPLSRMNAVAKTLIDLMPGPNRAGSPNFVRSLSDPLNIDTLVGRADWMRGKDSLFYHIVYSNQDSNTAPIFGLPLDGGGINVQGSRQRQMAATWTRVFSPTNLNELRAGYGRNYRLTSQVQEGEDLNGKFGLPFPFAGEGLGGLTNIAVTGFASMGSSAASFFQFMNKYEVADNFTAIRGSHTMRFGFLGILKVFQNRNSCNACRGLLTFNGGYTQQPGFNNTGNAAADFLFGTINNARYGNVWNRTNTARDVDFHAQDKWQATRRLTVTAGLRVSHHPAAAMKQGLISSVIFDAGYTNARVVVGPEMQQTTLDFMKDVLLPYIPVLRATEAGLNNALVKRNAVDFGPRLGLAFQLSRKTVIRGGYGIFYGYPDQASVNLGSNPPNNLSVSQTSNSIDPTLVLSQPIFAANPFDRTLVNPAFGGIRDVNFSNDLTQMYNLMVQRQFGSAWVLEIGYMGNRGSRILVNPNINDARPAVPTDTSSPQNRRIVSTKLGNLPFISPQGFSNYNALVVSMEKRFSQGLQLLANYTWSRAMGVAPPLNAGINTTVPRNPLNLGIEYGPLEFDIMHRSVFSYVYDLPFGKGRKYLSQANRGVEYLLGGWQVSGITTLQGGFPATPALSVSLGRTFTNSRPNAIGDPALTSRQPNDWISRNAFAIPTAAEIAAGNFFGNAGAFSIRQPGLVNFDFAALKNIPVREGVRIQFRAEFFNLTNTPFFGQAGSLTTNFSSPAFGTIGSAGDPRVMQLGLKAIF